jgi:hypothetical protein
MVWGSVIVKQEGEIQMALGKEEEEFKELKAKKIEELRALKENADKRVDNAH